MLNENSTRFFRRGQGRPRGTVVKCSRPVHGGLWRPLVCVMVCVRERGNRSRWWSTSHSRRGLSHWPHSLWRRGHEGRTQPGGSSRRRKATVWRFLQSAKDRTRGTASMDQSKLSLSGQSRSQALTAGRCRKVSARVRRCGESAAGLSELEKSWWGLLAHPVETGPTAGSLPRKPANRDSARHWCSFSERDEREKGHVKGKHLNQHFWPRQQFVWASEHLKLFSVREQFFDFCQVLSKSGSEQQL